MRGTQKFIDSKNITLLKNSENLNLTVTISKKKEWTVEKCLKQYISWDVFVSFYPFSSNGNLNMVAAENYMQDYIT